MALSPAGVELIARNAAQFRNDINSSGQAVAGFTQQVDASAEKTGRATGALSSFGSMAAGAAAAGAKVLAGAVLAAGAALSGVIAASIKTTSEFESALGNLGAVSLASADDLDAMRRAAAAAGSTTKFTATEATEALTFLSMAGFSSRDAIAALPGVLNLAAASNMELGRAADIASNILSGFGLSTEQTSHVVNVLALASARANTDVPMLGEAMKYAAPVAAMLGMSMEDATTAIAKMSDAGIQGSMAGTALRGGLLRLSAPTTEMKKLMTELGISVFDVNGKMLPLPDLITHLSGRLSGMSDAQRVATLSTLFGAEAVSGWGQLISVGGEELGRFSAELAGSSAAFGGQGVAAEMARRQLDNLKGQTILLQSAFDGLKITIGSAVTPILTALIRDHLIPLVGVVDRSIAQFIDWARVIADSKRPLDTLASMINEVTPRILKIIETWGWRFGTWMLDALPTMIVNLGTTISALITNVGSGTSPLQSKLSQWGAAFVEWLTKAVPVLLGALATATSSILHAVASRAPAWLATLGQWATAFVEWVSSAAPRLIAATATAIGHLLSIVGSRLGEWGSMLGAWGQQLMAWVIAAQPGLYSAINNAISHILGVIAANLPAWLGTLAQWSQGFISWLIDAAPQLIANAAQAAQGLVAVIMAHAPAIVSAVANWALGMTSWVLSEGLPKLLSNLGQLIGAFVSWIISQGPAILTAVAGWTVAIIGWVLTEALPKLLVNLGQLLVGFVGWLIGAVPQIVVALAEWNTALTAWVLNDAIPKLLSNMAQFAADLGASILERVPEMQAKAVEIGSAIIEGVKLGIERGIASVVAAARSLADRIPESIKTMLGIRSPSAVIASIAEAIPQGAAVGIERETPAAIGASASMVDGMADAIRERTEQLDGESIGETIAEQIAAGAVATAAAIATPTAAEIMEAFKAELKAKADRLKTELDLVSGLQGAFGKLADLATQQATLIGERFGSTFQAAIGRLNLGASSAAVISGALLTSARRTIGTIIEQREVSGLKASRDALQRTADQYQMQINALQRERTWANEARKQGIDAQLKDLQKAQEETIKALDKANTEIAEREPVLALDQAFAQRFEIGRSRIFNEAATIAHPAERLAFLEQELGFLDQNLKLARERIELNEQLGGLNYGAMEQFDLAIRYERERQDLLRDRLALEQQAAREAERARDRELSVMLNVNAAQRQALLNAIAQAEAMAQTNPQQAAEWLALQNQQIERMAQLQARLAAATNEAAQAAIQEAIAFERRRQAIELAQYGVAQEQRGIEAGGSATTNNYYYAPNYNGAPQSPLADFGALAALQG